MLSLKEIFSLVLIIKIINFNQIIYKHQNLIDMTFYLKIYSYNSKDQQIYIFYF